MKYTVGRMDSILDFLIAELFCPHVFPLFDSIV